MADSNLMNLIADDGISIQANTNNDTLTISVNRDVGTIKNILTYIEWLNDKKLPTLATKTEVQALANQHSADVETLNTTITNTKNQLQDRLDSLESLIREVLELGKTGTTIKGSGQTITSYIENVAKTAVTRDIITSGTSVPNATTKGKYYFKYDN